MEIEQFRLTTEAGVPVSIEDRHAQAELFLTPHSRPHSETGSSANNSTAALNSNSDH